MRRENKVNINAERIVREIMLFSRDMQLVKLRLIIQLFCSI